MWLCYREDSKVSHYIINKIQENNETKYRIGDQVFADLPSLLAFYKLHYLDTTPLLKPAVKPIEKVVAKYDFIGNVKFNFNIWCSLYMILNLIRTKKIYHLEEEIFWRSLWKMKNNGGQLRIWWVKWVLFQYHMFKK